MAAAYNENPAILIALLNAGADLNAQNQYGGTPLHVAAGNNENPAVITALLNAGADPAARDDKGRTPWKYAFRNEALKDSDVYWRLNDEQY